MKRVPLLTNNKQQQQQPKSLKLFIYYFHNHRRRRRRRGKIKQLKNETFRELLFYWIYSSSINQSIELIYFRFFIIIIIHFTNKQKNCFNRINPTATTTKKISNWIIIMIPKVIYSFIDYKQGIRSFMANEMGAT